MHLACERLELPQQHLEEGGLAAAVGADQRGALAAAQLQLVDGEERVAGVADGDLVGAQDDVAAGAGSGCRRGRMLGGRSISGWMALTLRMASITSSGRSALQAHL